MTKPLEPEILPDWLEPAFKDALADPTGSPDEAAVAVGRLLRSGALAAEVLTDWVTGAFDDDTLEQVAASTGAALAQLAEAMDDRDADPLALVVTRDDIESRLWTLGLPPRSDREAELLTWARRLDRNVGPHAERVALARKGAPPWLSVMAAQSEPCWWLSVLATDATAQTLERWFSSFLVGERARAMALAARTADEQVAYQYSTAGEAQIQQLLERPLGAPIAALFDGDVLVHAHGLADHDRDALPGLVVRHREGKLDDIDSVELVPPGPSPTQRSGVALCWWVPLAGAGTIARTLVVKCKGDEEELQLDPGEAPQ